MAATYTHLIWDFNGTLLDDVQLGIDSVNGMLIRRGLPAIPHAEAYRELFGFPIEDYYRRLGFDFAREDYETVLAPEWVANYQAGESACRLNDGVIETIAAVTQRGIGQLILSASELEQLRGQLARLGLENAFEEVLGLDNIHARSKSALAIEWRSRHPNALPLFIGDTEHDAAVADAIGADCVLFWGGHQSRARLSLCRKPMIGHIAELLAFL